MDWPISSVAAVAELRLDLAVGQRDDARGVYDQHAARQRVGHGSRQRLGRVPGLVGLQKNPDARYQCAQSVQSSSDRGLSTEYVPDMYFAA